MGHLISYLLNNSGHVFDFEYSGLGAEIKCNMKCSCGWRVGIESFQNSWSVIEVKVKATEHLSPVGLEPTHPIALYTFEEYTPKIP